MHTRVFLTVLEALDKAYLSWQAAVLDLIAIETGDPFRILISTILSLRTQDKTTAAASVRLYAVADTPSTIAKLDVVALEKLIYPVGFYKTKAKNIIKVCEILLNEHKGKVPHTLAELIALPNVGRKTANLVLALGFNIPAICVDTHVHRINNRLGMVVTKTPEETEFALMKKVPQEYWNSINKIFVAFGQTICRPIGPKCEICPVSKWCEYK